MDIKPRTHVIHEGEKQGDVEHVKDDDDGNANVKLF